MYGAIIGDMAGSRYEWTGSKSCTLPLLTDDCHVTDDSLATLAVAEALLETEGAWTSPALTRALIRRLCRMGRRYPDVGWGERFYTWMTEDPTPYGSFGNGAAMRISPVGWVAESEDEVRRLAYAVTAISHDHPDALLAAEAVAMAIYLARRGCTPDDLRHRLTRDYYPELAEMHIETLHAEYGMDGDGRFMTCAGSVPEALIAALEADDFETAVRNAVSLGGDADTQAAIAGSVAEALFGIPPHLIDTALAHLEELSASLAALAERFADSYGV